ncbi:TPA: LPXTG cell wall anchor domain-containing protein [Streptococcus suis]
MSESISESSVEVHSNGPGLVNPPLPPIDIESVSESISQSLSISESVSESVSKSISESVSGSEAITPTQQVPSQTLSESVLQALPSTGQESQTSLSLLGVMLLFGLLKKKKQKEEQE